MHFLLLHIALLTIYSSTTTALLPRITLADIPQYKFPCSGDISAMSEKQQARCKARFANYGFHNSGLGYSEKIGKNNNIFCKISKMCLNFSFGNLYLSAYSYWRSQGFYKPKNYNIHTMGGNSVVDAEAQRPRVDALKNAIS